MEPNLCKNTKSSLSATNLAAYHHFNCDLYLYNTYHGDPNHTNEKGRHEFSELTKAVLQKGNDWESDLYKWLANEDLLHEVRGGILTGQDIKEIIQFDDRDHFFVTGLTFSPPSEKFEEEFSKRGASSVHFGIAKPDLLEVQRFPDGTVKWQVIDAKSSKEVKTSHQVQIYFYHLCLSFLLSGHPFSPIGTAGVWVSPSVSGDRYLPSKETLRTVPLSLLKEALDHFLFSKLPTLLGTPRSRVKWHYNPLCRGCRYESSCRSLSVIDGRLGMIPNISLDGADSLRNLLAVSRNFVKENTISDIEDLHRVVGSDGMIQKLKVANPGLIKKAKQILALPKGHGVEMKSPLIEAAISGEIKAIDQRIYSLPKSEDIALLLSFVVDPKTSSICAYCISMFSNFEGFLVSPPSSGPMDGFIFDLSHALRRILDLNEKSKIKPRTQCYVFSQSERAALQKFLIDAALTTSSEDSYYQECIRLCIGALCEGAELLATTFQPMVMSGALLDFLGRQGTLKRDQLKICLSRLSLPHGDEGNEALLYKIRRAVKEMNADVETQFEGGTDSTTSHREIGQLPRVILLKKELQRLLALPVPGYWDLTEAYQTLSTSESEHRPCPSDDEIFAALQDGDLSLVSKKLGQRNLCMHFIVCEARKRATKKATKRDLLANDARVLSSRFMDVCRNDNLRKLFFMHQFETLTKLTGLWQARLDGCPDAPLLEYLFTTRNPRLGQIHSFRLVSGNIDVPIDKERAFFNCLLTEEQSDSELPVEALFDDLGLFNMVFPLNEYTKYRWSAQHVAVREKLFISDVQDLLIQGNRTLVTLRTFGDSDHRLRRGAIYRLSLRFVDFNLTKVLSTLIELDLSIPTDKEYLSIPPFVQLCSNPRLFASEGGEDPVVASAYLQAEARLQSTLLEAKNLEVTAAGALLLKSSQRRALRRILSNRLSVIWGPPGTGKTYTISLALLRFIEVRIRCGNKERQIVFLSAMTHAAVRACMTKLETLMDQYRHVPGWPLEWLHFLKLEHVISGNMHRLPENLYTYLYAGTVFQLYNFSKRLRSKVDCVVLDEAGQLGVGSASLALKSLSSKGKVIVAGDSEQLAPIFSAQYPETETYLFGSILDCLMKSSRFQDDIYPDDAEIATVSEQSQVSTIVQLTENFRLNEDLGDFVSTIYSKAFKPQKAQTKEVAEQLACLQSVQPFDDLEQEARDILLSLSTAMLRKPQSRLAEPPIASMRKYGRTRALVDLDSLHRQISLAMIRLNARTTVPDETPYECHVRGEATFAAALVWLIQKVAPNDKIFVATPYRVQRHAVKDLLKEYIDDLTEAMGLLNLDGNVNSVFANVTVDTVERLQGSEADFVICLFSHTHPSNPSAINFLLERRRLNVAISRAKTLCILVTSKEVLTPSIKLLTNPYSAKGYAFLKAYEERAWTTDVDVNLDLII